MRIIVQEFVYVDAKNFFGDVELKEIKERKLYNAAIVPRIGEGVRLGSKTYRVTDVTHMLDSDDPFVVCDVTFDKDVDA